MMSTSADALAAEKQKCEINMSQLSEHLQSGDPNKTVLLQGSDGRTQVFVNNDEYRNNYADGKSFEDIGDAKEIEFELAFRLHKDSTSVITSAGGKLSPAVPAITYHNHVWWFWTYELDFKGHDDDTLKASFSLKSVGPKINPHQELPRGALGENIPRTQMAPKIQNVLLNVNGKLHKLALFLGVPDNSYTVNDFITLPELNALFTEEAPFLTFVVSFAIPVSYFDVAKQAGIGEASTEIVPRGAEGSLQKIIQGEKVTGTDFVLTFGDSSKNDSVEYFVHRAALARTSPLLGQLFANKMNPPGDIILVPSSEDRFIFPHLRPNDAQFFLTYLYTQRIILPNYDAFARVGRVFSMVAERSKLMHLFKQWQRLLVENLLNAKKIDDSNLVVEECIKALISIYSAPYGSLPVAKRVAASMLADKISQAESKSENIIASLRADPKFQQYNIDKFLSSVSRLQLLISAVKKKGI